MGIFNTSHDDGGAGSASAGTFKLKAGVAIAQNDGVQLGPDGKAWPVKVTDYAAVANCAYGTAQTNAATGRIVAQTSIVGSSTQAFSKQAVVQGSDGNIYTLTDDAASTGLRLTCYSAAGALIAQATLDVANSYKNHHILLLSDGTLACLAQYSTFLNYAVYDGLLNPVKTLASVGEASCNVLAGGSLFSACTLAGGGFAVVFAQEANRLLSRLATFSNAGVAVLAPTTIWTRTGTAAAQYHKMRQLSSGNLVVAVSSTNTVSSIGLYHGIVTTGGASVLAFTNLDVASMASFPELSVMAGYYCVARANATTQLASVFSNIGALQGAGFTNATVTNSNRIKVVNDGAAFWLIWPWADGVNPGREKLTKLPTAGAGYVTTNIDTVTSQYNRYIDAFYENGMIVAVSQDGGTSSAPALWVISTATCQLVNASKTDFGSAASTAGLLHRVIPGGDFSFICVYEFTTAQETFLAIGKYANTAVMGVALAAAAEGSLVSVGVAAGAYATNQLNGTASKQFDHSAANIYGNKGALLSNGAVLKGF